MRMRKTIEVLEKITKPVSRWLNLCSVSILMVMVVFVATDVIGRYVFHKPIQSSYEAIQYMMVLVFSWGIAYTQRQKGHVAVDMLVNRFGTRSQGITGLIINSVSLAFLVIMVWQTLIQAQDNYVQGNTSLGKIAGLLYVPQFPFFYMISVTFAALALTYVLELALSLAQTIGQPTPGATEFSPHKGEK